MRSRVRQGALCWLRLAVVGSVIFMAGHAGANTDIRDRWLLKYPSSSSMTNAGPLPVGSGGCNLCHQSAVPVLNAYGNALGALLSFPRTAGEIDSALAAVESTNSDGDTNGWTNLEEIGQSTQPGWKVGDAPPPAVTGSLDPPVPMLSIDNVSQAEGNAGTTPFVFTVTLAPARLVTVTVQFATANGTATAGGDYTAKSGTVTFNPGVTTQPLSVDVSGDTTPEANETFTVTLSSPVNATLGTATGTGTIQNDDGAGTPPAITSAAPPAGIVSIPYSHTYVATGTPAPSFTVTSGALPAGVTLTSAGVLSGTPTVANTYTGTVTATNGVSPDATQNFSIVIAAAAAPVITSPPPPATGTAGVAYTHSYVATGTPAPTFMVTAGALPDGLSLNPSTGAVTGTPTVVGPFTGTVTASNGIDPASTQSFSITISAPTAPPAFTSAFPASGTVGLPYAHMFVATGTPAPTFAVTSGVLPAGLSLAANGLLSGTPQVPGTFGATVTASNGVNPPATQSFSIAIAQPVSGSSNPTLFSVSCPDPSNPRCSTAPFMPIAIVNPSPGLFTNCIASEGCFGTAGLVDTPPGGNMPAVFTVRFLLTPADIAAINGTPGTGRLTVIASRDLGPRASANGPLDPVSGVTPPVAFGTATDWLSATLDGQPLADLFRTRNAYSLENPSGLTYANAPECPAGERGGAGYPDLLNCGLNFHTDVRATQVIPIPGAALRAAASDGVIQVDLTPTLCAGTSCVGRVKFFLVRLEVLGDAPPIPTLSDWGRVTIVLLLALAAAWSWKRRGRGLR
jgi:hypothetical protein